MVPPSITTITIITTLMYLTHAGRKHTAALQESLSHLVPLTRRRMALYATLTASLASQESVPSAGRTALRIKDSVTTVPTATSLTHMVEELVKFTNATDVRNGAPFGTLNVTMNSIM